MFAGMMFPGNGCPVNGLRMAAVISENRPVASVLSARTRWDWTAPGMDAFVSAHEERPVAAIVKARDDNRAVDLSSELFSGPRILGQGRIVEVAAGVERIVLPEVEDRSVQIVRAALGDHVDVDAQYQPNSADGCRSAPEPRLRPRRSAACWSPPAGWLRH